MSDVKGSGGRETPGGMYSEDQCIMGNDDIGTPLWTGRHKWKHYLPATSIAGGNNIGGNEGSNASSWINTTEGISILFGSHVVNFIPSTGYPCLSWNTKNTAFLQFFKIRLRVTKSLNEHIQKCFWIACFFGLTVIGLTARFIRRLHIRRIRWSC